MDNHIIYIFFAILFLAFLNKKWGLYVGFAILIWMFSFRTSEIPDTEIYQWMYDDPISRFGINEIGFLALGMVFQSITGFDFLTFYITLVGMCLMLWNYGTKKLLPDEKDGILFLLFLSFFGFFYLGITIRNCLSELLVLCGLSFFLKSKGKKRVFLFSTFVVLAMLIHRSAAFFLLLLPLIRPRISYVGYYRIYVMCIFLWLVSGSDLSRGIVGQISKLSMFSKLENYSTSAEAAPSMLSLQILINWLISFFVIKYQKVIEPRYGKLYDFFLKINMVGLITLSVIWSVPTSYRFYNMFFFFNYIPIYLMSFHNMRIKKQSGKIIFSFLFCFVYFIILLHSFPVMLLY